MWSVMDEGMSLYYLYFPFLFFDDHGENIKASKHVFFIRRWFIRKECSTVPKVKKVQYWSSDSLES